MSVSDWLAAAAVVIAVAALVLSWYAIQRANKTTSAATMVTLNEGLRSAWARLFAAPAEQKQAELAELCNLFEIACATWQEGSVTGNAKELLREYLDNVLDLLAKHPSLCTEIDQLLQNERTFKFIKQYLKANPNRLPVTIPMRWDQ